ncbi:Tigger transposable element-derived protein 4 [Entomophthora muscae]|uniref:Tigger transposable element-derived protein 4 n=1 Tax=Entomophthora muscae TaxID=34485 RepID=A0ACC2U2Z7_9FUNG|nr:Tigger transposable element-derived protein 4 [Entomophthora muscae]
MIEDQPVSPSLGLFPGQSSHPHAVHKRHVLTLKERVAVLKYLDSHPKATTTEVCHLFSSNPRTIRRIQDKRETLLNLPDGDKRLSRTRFTKGTCLPVEACVLKWMDLAHLSKRNITNLTLQSRAKFFFALIKSYLPNLPFLAASNGWINRFKVRNSINLKVLMSESETFFAQELVPVREKIHSSLRSYMPQNIFSLSMSMLYFSFIPTPKYPFPRGSKAHSPPSERVNLILCSNSDASEKLTPSIIHSS